MLNEEHGGQQAPSHSDSARRVRLDTALSKAHISVISILVNHLLINDIGMDSHSLHPFCPGNHGGLMELVFTTIAVIGGMTFSLAVALLVEELIFGKVLGVFFSHRPQQTKAAVER
jgi:hypothetical protein